MLRLTTTAATTGYGWGARVAAAAASMSAATASTAGSGGSRGHATRSHMQPTTTTMTTTTMRLRPASLLSSSHTQPRHASPLLRRASSLARSHAQAVQCRPVPVPPGVGVLASRQQPVRRLSDDGSPKPKPGPPSSLPPYARRENIYTVPNFLTAGRIVAAPFIGYCIVNDQPALALGLLATAAFTDLLDGWIARRWNLHTVVGSIIDPMADKILMTVLTVSLAAQGSLPLWLAVLILGRDAGLGCSAIYYRWVSLPPPKTFARYWDFSLPSAEVRPTTISKYNTFLQLALMAATTAAPVVAGTAIAGSSGLDPGPYLTALQYVVGVTTVWSGASYVFSKDAVKILTKKTK